MRTPANFNGDRPVIDPDDAALLMIDHQSGLFQTVAVTSVWTHRAADVAILWCAT